MVELDATNRERVWRWFMRRNTDPCSFTKADLRAAIDACDTWIEANQAAFNTALPQPFRGQATAAQKTLMFCFVAERRAGLLRVEEDG
jgi:hypothetical protein